MKIIMNNLIVSVRVLAGSFTFMLFMVAGVLADAEPHVLLIGGAVAWLMGYTIGMAMANILEQIDKETQLNPVEDEDDHKKGVGGNLDILQNFEMPSHD